MTTAAVIAPEPTAPAIPELTPWWPHVVEIYTWEEWLKWWNTGLPKPFHLLLLERIFFRREDTSQALRFLLNIIAHDPPRQRGGEVLPRHKEVRDKAIEVFLLKFLNEKVEGRPDPWDVDPSWADVIVKDPQIFAIILHFLVRHERDISSDTHHYRSIVKKFLKRCMLLHGWGHNFRDGTEQEAFERIREVSLVEFYRALFVWEVDGLIMHRLDDLSLDAVEALVFEAGQSGQKPKSVEEAIAPPEGVNFGRSIFDIPICQAAAARRLLLLRIMVRAEKRDLRIKRQNERLRRKALRREQRQV